MNNMYSQMEQHNEGEGNTFMTEAKQGSGGVETSQDPKQAENEIKVMNSNE